MDHLHERLERLEQRTHTVERQLRWWRGLTCALVVLSLLSLALSSGKAADAQSGTLAERLAAWREEVATLRDTLVHITTHIKSATDAQGVPEVVITGANLRIVNGLGRTDCGTEEEPIPDCPNGQGNLIVGYNRSRQDFPFCSGSTDPSCADRRTGSHNVVAGDGLNFTSFGGLVVGSNNEIGGQFVSVSGGSGNTASGIFASVSGGKRNTASTEGAAVSGGVNNTASGDSASVSGGGRTRPARRGPRSAAGTTTRPAATSPRSAPGYATRPAAKPPPSAGGDSTRPAVLGQQSVRGMGISPAAKLPLSVAGVPGYSLWRGGT
jgi:hypothetical protein